MINPIQPIIETFKLTYYLWRLSPIVMTMFIIWIFGVSWCNLTFQRDFFKSMVWFIPIKYLNKDKKNEHGK